MRYKAVIFDLDGTLLNTLEDLKTSVNFALCKHNMPQRTLDEVRHFVGNGVRKLMERAIPGGEQNPEFEETFSDFKAHYLVHCNDTTMPYSNIMELLQWLLKNNYQMAIVSNKYMGATQELAGLYFADYIQVAIGERTNIRKKPAPDTVIEAMRELGVPKEDCLYVGDSEVDVQTARNVGIPCISCLWGFRDKDFLLSEGAGTLVSDPLEIGEILSSGRVLPLFGEANELDGQTRSCT